MTCIVVRQGTKWVPIFFGKCQTCTYFNILYLLICITPFACSVNLSSFRHAEKLVHRPFLGIMGIKQPWRDEENVGFELKLEFAGSVDEQ